MTTPTQLPQDEIDLRPYFNILFQKWWLVALATILGAALGLVLSQTQERTYTATAALLLTRSRSNLSLAEQFPTVSEPVDSRSRMDAILSLIQSDDFIVQVVNTLDGTLPPAYQIIDQFRKLVKISNKGDLIMITIKSADPGLAAQIANTWANQAAAVINQAYSNEQSISELQARLAQSKQDYTAAQANLEAFIKESQAELYKNQLLEAQTLLSNLVKDHARQLAYYSDRQRAMQELAAQAATLKQQLQNSSSSQAGHAGVALAVLNARLSTLGGSTTVPAPVIPAKSGDLVTLPETAERTGPGLTIQLDLAQLNDSPESLAAELDKIIQYASAEQARAGKALAGLVAAASQDVGSEGLKATTDRIQALQTALENQEARQRELTSQRDLARETSEAMSKKEAELRNALQSGRQVNLATRAIIPQAPDSRGTLSKMIAGGLLGFVISVMGILIFQWRKLAREAPTA